MTDLLETRTYEQLSPATVAEPGDLIALQTPGGPLKKIDLAKIIGRLGPVDVVAEEFADLTLVHDAGELAIVYADPDPVKNTYYVKTGASGAGAWARSNLFRIKGDPGGNVMAIGLFGDGPLLLIPLGTDMVRTKGYAATGRGIADYVYSAAVDAAYVAANPRSSFISANGRGFKLAAGQYQVTQFGAVGNGIADDTDACRAALNLAAASFIAADPNGGGAIVWFPAGRYRHSGLVQPQGVSIEGEGPTKSILLVYGVGAANIKCAAATSQLAADQVSYGHIKGVALRSADATPVSQAMWNAIGFSRFTVQEVQFQFCGGCTGISIENATPASLGGPAQWHVRLNGCEWLHVGPNGGVAWLAGDSETTHEGLTTWIVSGGQVTGNGTGTGFNLRGAIGCTFDNVCFQGLATATVIGNASGDRFAVSNSFYGCYWEGNTINRDIKITSYGARLSGSFITGGTDATDNGTSSAYDEFTYGADWKIPAGLKFGAASADPNALDHYAEADFSPTVTFTTPGDVARTYGAANLGKYTRVGNRVIGEVDLDVTSLTFTTAAGDLRIGGFPFAAAAGPPGAGAITFMNPSINMDAGQTMLAVQIQAGQSYALLVQNGDAILGENIDIANLTTGNSLRIQFSFSYPV